MKISKSVETEDGTIQFAGELSPDEVEFIIGIGLNYLVKTGAIPFKVTSSGSSQLASFIEGNDTPQ